MRHGATSIVLVSLLLVAISPQARAQPVNGFYVAGSAGVDLSQSQTIERGSSAGVAPDSAAAHAAAAINRPGPTESGSAGWGFGDGLRMEMQGVHTGTSTSGSVP